MKGTAKLKEQARKHEQKEEWERAIQLYQEVLESRSEEEGSAESELALYNRVGDIFLRLGKPKDAVRYYEDAADKYAEAGFYNNAIALCNKALRYLPERPELYQKLGRLCAEQGFFTDARRWFLEYAERLARAGKQDESFAALEEFATLSNDPDVWVMLGRQRHSHEQSGEAVEAMRNAFRLHTEAGNAAAAEEVRSELATVDAEAAASLEAGEGAVAAGPAEAETEYQISGEDELGLEPTVVAGEDLELEPTSLSDDFGTVEGDDLEVEHGARLAGPETDEAEDLGGVAGLETFTEFQAEAAEEEAEPLEQEPEPLEEEPELLEEEPEPREEEAKLLEEEPEPLEEEAEPLEEEAEEEEEGEPLPMLTAFEDEEAAASPLATLDEEEAEQEEEEEPEPLPMLGEEDMDLSFGVEGEEEAEPVPSTAEEGDEDLSFGDMAFATEAEEAEAPTEAAELAEAEEVAEGEEVEEAGELETLVGGLELGSLDFGVETAEEPLSEAPTSASPMPAGATGGTAHVAVPDKPEVLNRAKYLAERGQTEDALEKLEELATSLADAGRLDEALEITEEMERIAPDDLRPFNLRVEYAFREGDQELLVKAYLALADQLSRSGAAVKSKTIYQRVLDLEPNNKRALAALGQEGRGAQPTPRSVPVGDQYVDLAGLLDQDSLTETTRFVVEEDVPTGDEDKDFADMLAQFKTKVAEHVAVEDTASHYDLGLAFKEMGLIDEAIAEFQVALRHGRDRLKVYEELGQCFMLKGQHNVAVKILTQAVVQPGASGADMVGVFYHLGRCHEELGNKQQAKDAYEQVMSIDIAFQDVTDRLAAL